MRILLLGNPNVGKSAVFSRLTGTQVVVSNYSGTTVEYARGNLLLENKDAELIDAPGVFSLDPANKAEEVAVTMLHESDVVINVLDAGNLERNLHLTLQLLQTGKPVIVLLNMWDEALGKNIRIDIQKLESLLGVPVIASCAVSGEGIDLLKNRLADKLTQKIHSSSHSGGMYSESFSGAPHSDSFPGKQQSDLDSGGTYSDTFSGGRQSGILDDRQHSETQSTEAHLGEQRDVIFPCEQGDMPQTARDTLKGSEELWQDVERIIAETQSRSDKSSTFRQKLDYGTVHPVWGPFIALFVLVISFGFVALFGDFLHELLEGAFELLWLPVVAWTSSLLGGGGLVHDVLIGDLINGQVNFFESFGLITTGLFIPIAVVLPFIFCFYVALSLLEDIGYLPRLGVVVDSMMQRLGIHGLSIVPMMLGVGCNVPGVMAGRMLETRRERFIVATLITIAVPCMAQQAMVIGLLGQAGMTGLVIVYVTLFLLWILMGRLMNFFLKGEATEMLLDLPPYRRPYWQSLIKKIYMRMNGFIRNALPFVLLGVVVVNLLYTIGVIGFISNIFAPVLTGLFGLPGEAGGALIVGFLRKDVAVGMLAPLGMDLHQLIVASVVLMVYFPCIATFVVLFKELGLWDLIKLIGFMILIVVLTGGGLHLLLQYTGI